MTSTTQRMRATNGGIRSRTLYASVWELKTELSSNSETKPAHWTAAKNNQSKIIHNGNVISMSYIYWKKEAKGYQ